MSFDRLSGQLYVGDVGQNELEEIDVIIAGGNYGWRIKEGTAWFHPNGRSEGTVSGTADPMNLPPSNVQLIDPIAQYNTHAEGHSVIGGFVYRGARFPNLRGQYLFAELALTFNPRGPSSMGRLLYLQGSQGSAPSTGLRTIA